MQQLPAFLSATLGGAFGAEAGMLVLYVFLLNIRRSIWSMPILSGECGRSTRQASTLEIAGSNPAPGSNGARGAPGVESAPK